VTEVRTRTAATFTSPATDPGGARRREVWAADSLDGLWTYERHEDTGTTWSAIYLPTGQCRDGFRELLDAQEHTAGTLRGELGLEAFHRAGRADLDVAARAQAQLWLGVHLAADGQVEPEARCECGGLLVAIQYRGDPLWAHLAACGECWTHNSPGLHPDPDVCRHTACGDLTPTPRTCVHDGCHGEPVPDGGLGCATGRGECCRCCSELTR